MTEDEMIDGQARYISESFGIPLQVAQKISKEAVEKDARTKVKHAKKRR